MNVTLTQDALATIIAEAVAAGVAAALGENTTTAAPGEVLAKIDALEASAKKTPAKKADPRYRTAKQNADGRARYEALWADLKKANPGVSSKDLAKTHRAALNACYVKGTRKAPAAK